MGDGGWRQDVLCRLACMHVKENRTHGPVDRLRADYGSTSTQRKGVYGAVTSL